MHNFWAVQLGQFIAGIFSGPQACEFITNKGFPSKLTVLELRALESFVPMMHNFLSSHKASNHKELVDSICSNTCDAKCHLQ